MSTSVARKALVGLAVAVVLATAGPAYADHERSRCYGEECYDYRYDEGYDEGYDQEYDQWNSNQRNHNRRNRGAFSPGPFDRSPIDFSYSCISLDCSGRERREDQEPR